MATKAMKPKKTGLKSLAPTVMPMAAAKDKAKKAPAPAKPAGKKGVPRRSESVHIVVLYLPGAGHVAGPFLPNLETNTMSRSPQVPPKTSPSRRWLEDWERRVGCSTPAMETITTDPFTTQQLIAEGTRKQQRPLILWDCVTGFRDCHCRLVDADGQDTGSLDLKRATQDRTGFTEALAAVATKLGGSVDFRDPLTVLQTVALLPTEKYTNPSTPHAVFVLINFYPYFDNDEVRQEFDNIVQYQELVGEASMRPIHFLQAPFAKLNLRGIEAVRHHIEPMPLPLPDIAELRAGPVVELMDTITREDNKRGYPVVGSDYTEAHLVALATACVGLSRPRAVAQLYYASSKKKGIRSDWTEDKHGQPLPPLVTLLSDFVAQELAATGTMEIVADADIVPPEDIAGVERAITKLEQAAIKFTPAAVAQHLDPARGLYFAGLEGSGKSMLARAASAIFERHTGRHWKVVQVKMPAMYGSLYGETEQNWFDFESRIAAFGECICIFEEVDKIFGGVAERNAGSGVEKSLFGLWLDWMGSKTKRGQVFPILCMNDPSVIPREALRAGRLDAGFYFDMPDAATRTAIARIHFAKRLKPLCLTLDALAWSAADWNRLGEEMKDYLPGEIETLVAEARDLAFDPSTIRLPTFDQTITLVTERRRERNADADAMEDHRKRMQAMDELKRKCRAMDCRPVRGTPPAAAITSEKPKGRGRIRSDNPELN